jgi:hypothetical protein
LCWCFEFRRQDQAGDARHPIGYTEASDDLGQPVRVDADIVIGERHERRSHFQQAAIVRDGQSGAILRTTRVTVIAASVESVGVVRAHAPTTMIRAWISQRYQ